MHYAKRKLQDDGTAEFFSVLRVTIQTVRRFMFSDSI